MLIYDQYDVWKISLDGTSPLLTLPMDMVEEVERSYNLLGNRRGMQVILPFYLRPSTYEINIMVFFDWI